MDDIVIAVVYGLLRWLLDLDDQADISNDDLPLSDSSVNNKQQSEQGKTSPTAQSLIPHSTLYA